MITPGYVLRNGGATISTAITILQLKAGTGYPLELLRATLTQTGSSTAAQAHVGLLFKTGAATVTAASAGTTLNKMGAHGITSDVVLSRPPAAATPAAPRGRTARFWSMRASPCCPAGNGCRRRERSGWSSR